MLRGNRKIMFILTGISVIIGVMLATQLQSNLYPKHTESRNISELRSALQKELERHKNLLADISKYDLLYYQYKTALDDQESLAVMREELERTRKMAGLSKMEGSGIVVNIYDMPKAAAPVNLEPEPAHPENGAVDEVTVPALIDEDLRWLVNVLFIHGAKAVSINNNRLIAISSIRNVGTDIQVDTKTIRPPYVIQALGDSEVLMSGLKVEGAEEYFRFASKTLVVEKREKLTIPPYTGNRSIRYMKPVNEKGDS